MAEYFISSVNYKDENTLNKVKTLLLKEGLRLDSNLDYTCALMDDDYNVVATGSCFKNTLRCLAVDSLHQGEGLMNQIMTHLIEVQYKRNNTKFFLYTKYNSAKFFKDLGFYEICKDKQIVFMENERDGFQNYLDNLKKESPLTETTAIVMNANPFTLGHRYLIETALKENKPLHLFVVSEDMSLFPYEVRKKLIIEGTSDLENIYLHESGPYIISSATFPSYFQKDEESVIKSHATVDALVFGKIAESLNIKKRFLGEEPFSKVTNLYNQSLMNLLPQYNVELSIIPRKKINNQEISASIVRELIQKDDYQSLKDLLPSSTYNYLISPEAKEVVNKIKESSVVKHY